MSTHLSMPTRLSRQALTHVMVGFITADQEGLRKKEGELLEERSGLDDEFEQELKIPQRGRIDRSLADVRSSMYCNKQLLEAFDEGLLNREDSSLLLRVEGDDGEELWIIIPSIGDANRPASFHREGLEKQISEEFGVSTQIMTTECRLAQKLNGIKLEPEGRLDFDVRDNLGKVIASHTWKILEIF